MEIPRPSRKRSAGHFSARSSNSITRSSKKKIAEVIKKNLEERRPIFAPRSVNDSTGALITDVYFVKIDGKSEKDYVIKIKATFKNSFYFKISDINFEVEEGNI